MANVKITGLPALTTPATADLLEIVDDVAGTPTSKKITIADLLKSPGPIGGTAPGTGAFTTLTASSFINGAYATVASHATTSAIWAAAGNIINFTGSETITDFPAADQAGAQRTLICAGATVFTHAGNITVQGGVTYTAAANEVVTVTALSTTTFHVTPMETQSGATTEILVGGGASTAPVWTTATGTGAPVRATSPTVTGLTADLGADLDGGGNYAVDLQNFPDMLAKGPGYWFDGVDDVITGTDSFPGVDEDFSIIFAFNTDDVTTEQTIFNKYVTASDRLGIQIYNGSIVSNIINGSAHNASGVISTNTNYIGVLVWDASAETSTLYLNGKLQTGTTTAQHIGTSTGIFIGLNASGGAYPFGGSIFKVGFESVALSAAEVKAFSNGAPVPYKYLGASQTELVTDGDCSSDSFTTGTNWSYDGGNNEYDAASATGYQSINQDIGVKAGKKYRVTFTIKNYSGGGSLLASLGSYDTGTLRTANGTYTEEIEVTNGAATALLYLYGQDSFIGSVTDFSVTQIGQVAAYEPSGVTPSQWLDNSGNSLHGTVSGAKVINRPVQKIVQQNLLTNTDWIANSQSTLVEVTSGAAPVTDGANAALVNNLLTNGGFDSATTGWTAGNSATLSSQGTGKTGNGLLVARNGVNYPNAYQSATVVIGKLYQVSIYNQDKEVTGVLKIGSSIGAEDLGRSNLSSAGSFTITTHIVRATTTTLCVTLSSNATGATDGTYFDSVTLYEVTPGYVAADTKGPDGWSKDSTIDVYREHKGSNTKAGSFYAVRIEATGSAGSLYTPGFGVYDVDSVYALFENRTVTIGMWVKTSTASHSRLFIFDDGAPSYSDYHTGSGNYEWIEKTLTAVGTSTFRVGIENSAKTATTYVSSPVLIFGDHIGEGNFSRKPEEWVYLESKIASNLLTGSWSTVSATTLNLEADTNGKIGKGVQAIKLMATVRDSASAASNAALLEFAGTPPASDAASAVFSPGGLTNDVYLYGPSQIVACDSNGDIEYRIFATGSATFEISSVQISAIQLR